MDFIINITHIEDAMTLRDGQFIEFVFTHASELVNTGGRIIIQREYENSDPDNLAIFTTKADLEGWKSKLDAILQRLQENQ